MNAPVSTYACRCLACDKKFDSFDAESLYCGNCCQAVVNYDAPLVYEQAPVRVDVTGKHLLWFMAFAALVFAGFVYVTRAWEWWRL